MKRIAQVLLFDCHNKLLIYLRDDKPGIPFPNQWDFFGGHIEDKETPEDALVREVKEELGVALSEWQFFARYECTQGDVYPNTKYIYRAKTDREPADLVLFEGQKLTSISIEERFNYSFANILGRVLEDFIAAGWWPGAVDNLSAKTAAK